MKRVFCAFDIIKEKNMILMLDRRYDEFSCSGIPIEKENQMKLQLWSSSNKFKLRSYKMTL